MRSTDNKVLGGGQARMLAVILAAILALAILVPMRAARASNVISGASGPVSVEFVFADADFINTMSVTAPVNRRLFNTEQNRIGTRTDLGTFSSGTTFRFQLQAKTADGSFTWSSDPAQNSDGEDHLRVTELYDGDQTLDNRVYKLEWEDDEDLGDRDFNDAVAILRIGADSDGDGLYDDWERFGIDANLDGDFDDPGERDLPNGIDQNGTNGTNDPGERADPQHKDIFIEFDWMDCATAGGDCAAGDTHSHRPQAQAITNVIQAFRNHPSVSNPDGQNGINVHIDASNAIRHQNVLNFNGGDLGCSSNTAGTNRGDFDTEKAANFNNAAVRRYAYHYALAIHVENAAALTVPAQRFSGCGETFGNDFYISFGGWNGGGGPTVQQEAGTIMHELGHNLRLDHSGNEGNQRDVNYKPNYLSIMNYAFTLRGIPPSNRLDYSRNDLPDLNENSLDENVGIQDGTDTTLFFCPGSTTDSATTSGNGTGSINWDCVAPDPDPNPVSVDINRSGGLQTLTGFDDWPTVVQSLPFQTSGDFQDGVHPDTPVDELDFQEAIDNRLLSSPPILAPIQDQSARYSDTVTYTISATDADSDCADLSFSATGLPSGLSLTDNGDCTATVSGVISAEFGSYPVTYTVTDASGPSDSATGTFTVRPLYTFDGFFSPVDNLPTVNVVKAGSVVPVRFSLGGDFGLDVFAADSPWSVNIPTNPGAPLDSIEETVTAGSSELSYAEGSDQYTYVWKTSKSWAGTSRQLVVKFKDGTKGVANFTFK
jgi:hypothetical protein